MKQYLDVCCLCRPFDHLQNHKILLESEAVHTILDLCKHEHTLVSSQVSKDEIQKISNPEKRNQVLNLLSITGEYIFLTDEIVSRAQLFHEAGLRTYDALHLACVELASAIFITSYDKIIRTIRNNPNLTRTRVNNPVFWVMEEHHA